MDSNESVRSNGRARSHLHAVVHKEARNSEHCGDKGDEEPCVERGELHTQRMAPKLKEQHDLFAQFLHSSPIR